MSSVEVSKLSKEEVAQLACTYAALILYDDGQDITSDKLATLISAAGVQVDSYWPKLFAKAVAGKDISQYFNFGGSSAGSAPVQAPVAKEVAKEAPKEAPKDDKKGGKKKVVEEPKEEEEEGGMGGLFDDWSIYHPDTMRLSICYINLSKKFFQSFAQSHEEKSNLMRIRLFAGSYD